MVKVVEALSPNPESPFSFQEDHEAKRRVQFQFYWRRREATLDGKHVHACDRPTNARGKMFLVTAGMQAPYICKLAPSLLVPSQEAACLRINFVDSTQHGNALVAGILSKEHNDDRRVED